MRLPTLFFASLILFGFLHVCRADFKIVSETVFETVLDRPTQVAVSDMTPGPINTVVVSKLGTRSDSGNVGTIQLLSPNKMIMLFHARKSYRSLQPLVLHKRATDGKVEASPFVWENTGKIDKIAGFDGQHWTIKLQGRLSYDAWIATSPEMAEWGLMNWGILPSPPVDAPGKPAFPKFGIVLKLIKYDTSDKPCVTTTVKTFEHIPHDPSLFSPPEGYSNMDGPSSP